MRLRDKSSSIYVAGHTGLVGSALVHALSSRGFNNLITRTSSDVDLRDQAAVALLFNSTRPDFVIVAAARVGGILANNKSPVEFLADNLSIELNVIQQAAKASVKRLIFLGSSCVYPRLAPQPLQESALLSGPLEDTNQWYAIAKIAGIKLCEAYYRQYGHDFISLMPTNLYGRCDNFDLETSHVLPGLIRKFHEAKTEGPDTEVLLWGTGSPKREFLHADDFAKACLHVLETPESRLAESAPERLINVGSGSEVTIRDLAKQIQRIVGSENPVRWDHSKPDGTPRKLLDGSILRNLGWIHEIGLEKGISETYQWFTEQDLQ